MKYLRLDQKRGPLVLLALVAVVALAALAAACGGSAHGSTSPKPHSEQSSAPASWSRRPRGADDGRVATAMSREHPISAHQVLSDIPYPPWEYFDRGGQPGRFDDDSRRIARSSASRSTSSTSRSTRSCSSKAQRRHVDVGVCRQPGASGRGRHLRLLTFARHRHARVKWQSERHQTSTTSPADGAARTDDADFLKSSHRVREPGRSRCSPLAARPARGALSPSRATRRRRPTDSRPP